jgi:hypothetical protein
MWLHARWCMPARMCLVVGACVGAVQGVGGASWLHGEHDVRAILSLQACVAAARCRKLMSHPQALAQTDGYWRRMGHGVVREAVDDTAGAAKMIAENGWK